MNEVVKIGSYEDDDNYGSEKRSKHHSSAAPFQRQFLSSTRFWQKCVDPFQTKGLMCSLPITKLPMT